MLTKITLALALAIAAITAVPAFVRSFLCAVQPQLGLLTLSWGEHVLAVRS
jgi:hypothetical protein